MFVANWDKILSRGNVEDRRSAGPVFGGAGLVGVVVVVAFSLMNGDPTMTTIEKALSQLSQQSVSLQSGDGSQFQGADSYETFASTVLGSTNDTWAGVFQKADVRYDQPKLVLFRSATNSGCGVATSDVGPHYCPADKTIYLDETFFDELTKRFGAKGGDVAQAYVIAHEVGHHVQNELGIMDQIDARADAQSTGATSASVKLELQADCFAGVWGHSVQQQGVLLPDEIEEALDAAAAVGDDRIQSKVEGQVTPETWTHGSSAQRVQWFNVGFNSGNAASCDTFR